VRRTPPQPQRILRMPAFRWSRSWSTITSSFAASTTTARSSGRVCTAYMRGLSLTQQRHDAGIAPGLDVSQAQTQLNAARSQAAQTLAQRALMEHAIAALLGVSASTFSINPEIVAIKLPQTPSGVPSTLLERRPDISAAQRRMVVANANIGVARAAYFPTLTLGAQGGFQSGSISNWLSAPSAFWAIGPNALFTVFDGGLRRAQVAQARAEFDASAANYRSTVVSAFQQVEDSLATLNHYHDAAVEEKAAVDAAQRTLGLIHGALCERCDRLSHRRHLPDSGPADPAGGAQSRYPAADAPVST
jgi:NodT family efflux transporter outer membrane factor (OMF) lipoprotein